MFKEFSFTSKRIIFINIKRSRSIIEVLFLQYVINQGHIIHFGIYKRTLGPSIIFDIPEGGDLAELICPYSLSAQDNRE